MFSRDCFIFLADDFGGLILYLGFLGLNWDIRATNMKKKTEEQTKKEETIDCLQGANPAFSLGLRA